MDFEYSFIRRADLQRAADRLGVPLAVVKAVAAVEGRNAGFIKGTNLPKILFEGHQFSKRTGGEFDAVAPSISYRKWTKVHYRGGVGEYQRLKQAIDLCDGDPDPALKSTSWGMFQIMGFNFAAAGYRSVTEFVDWMAMGENHHLRGFIGFIESEGLGDNLRSQAWADFARAYNGSGFKKNNYDTRIAEAFHLNKMKLQEEKGGGSMAVERGDVALVQAALNIAIDADLAADGWSGKLTARAIRRFQSENGMEPTGEITPALLTALDIDVSGDIAREGAQ